MPVSQHHRRVPAPGENALSGPMVSIQREGLTQLGGGRGAGSNMTKLSSAVMITVSDTAATSIAAATAAANAAATTTPDSSSIKSIAAAKKLTCSDEGPIIGVDWSHLTANNPACMSAASSVGRGYVTQTPSTQASSPSPSFVGTNGGRNGMSMGVRVGDDEDDHDDDDDDDEHIDELIVATATSTTLELEHIKAAGVEQQQEEDDYYCNHGPELSQGDQHVYDACQSGSLNEVVGSQSMLSQEILGSSSGGCTQDSLEQDGGDENLDGDSGQPKKNKKETYGINDLILSQETESSVGIARRLGLLSQTQESEDEGEGDERRVLTVNTEKCSPQTSKTASDSATSVAAPTTTGAFASSAFSVANPPLTPLSSKFIGKDISDTPVRQSENFGSLLDAVAKITEEEEVDLSSSASWRTGGGGGGGGGAGLIGTGLQSTEHVTNNTSASNRGTTESSVRLSIRRRKPSAKRLDAQLSQHDMSDLDEEQNPSRKRKYSLQSSEAKKIKVESSSETKILDLTSPNGSNNQKKKMATPTSSNKQNKSPSQTKTVTQKELKDTQVLMDQLIAQRAAALAARTITDPVIAKKLLLSMALVRENPRSVPEIEPGPGYVLQSKFVWSHHPSLESILKAHMKEYYDLSTTKCQSAHQQSFNNSMVALMKDAVKAKGWAFDSCFDDKTLRDRIRCYYKTHIQNAKKRLRTMVQNPTKRANARHLVEHLDLIEKNNGANSQKAPEPTRRPQEPPKPRKMKVALVPSSGGHRKVESAKKKKTPCDDDVLAKVNSVIPPFSPVKESSRYS